jgi:hypothetical protein
MAFLLDLNKQTITTSVVNTGTETNPQVTLSGEAKIVVNEGDAPSFEVKDDGNINLGNDNVDSTINIIGGICYKYKELTENDISYNLTSRDYIVDVISPTYNEIILPNSVGNPGCTYIISRGYSNTNNNLFLKSQLGEFIDSETECRFWREGTRIQVVSNGAGIWYIQ